MFDPNDSRPPSRLLTQIGGITALLTAAHVAIPDVMGVVTSVIGIIQSLRGQAPPMGEIIAQLDQQVAANQTRGRAEIDALKAEIAAQG